MTMGPSAVAARSLRSSAGFVWVWHAPMATANARRVAAIRKNRIVEVIVRLGEYRSKGEGTARSGWGRYVWPLGKLASGKVGKHPIRLHQLVVGASFDDFPLVYNEDSVCISNRAEPMCNHQARRVQIL